MEGVAGKEWCTLIYAKNCGQDTTAATQDSAHYDGMKVLSTIVVHILLTPHCRQEGHHTCTYMEELI